MSTLAENNYLYRRPYLYDELAGVDESKAEQVTRLVAAHRVPPAVSVCDFGCGTGRDLDQLCSFARRVGVDLQDGMIGYGRRLRPQLDLRVGDVRTIRLAERFDVLMCLGNSYAYLHHDRDQVEAWRTFTVHARPATLLIVQTLLMPVEPVAIQREHVSTPTFEAGVSWEIDWDSDRRISTMRRTWHTDEPQTDIIKRRVTTAGELAMFAVEHGWTVPDETMPAGYFVAVRLTEG